MLGADEHCHGAYKRITSCLLHIRVGTNGSSIGVCRIDDATYEILWKLAISRARRLLRRPVDVRRQLRVLWCIQAYHESPIIYTSWYERFQYRLVLYWRCYIRNTLETGAVSWFEARKAISRCLEPTKTTLVHTRVSPIAYYRYKIN